MTSLGNFKRFSITVWKSEIRTDCATNYLFHRISGIRKEPASHHFLFGSATCNLQCLIPSKLHIPWCSAVVNPVLFGWWLSSFWLRPGHKRDLLWCLPCNKRWINKYKQINVSAFCLLKRQENLENEFFTHQLYQSVVLVCTHATEASNLTIVN